MVLRGRRQPPQMVAGGQPRFDRVDDREPFEYVPEGCVVVFAGFCRSPLVAASRIVSYDAVVEEAAA